MTKCEKMNNCTTWSKLLNLLFLSEQIYKILHVKINKISFRIKKEN